MSGIRQQRAFTFVEVTAALAIGAFVTLVAMGAMKSISVGAHTVRTHSEMAAEMRFVADLLQADLDNLYRDRKAENRKLTGGLQPIRDSEQATLCFYTVSRHKARSLHPESDVYEVEYAIMESEDKSLFTRRVWPNPDKENEPGGLLTVLSDRIIAFQVRFYDGSEWLQEWPEEVEELPELVEVNLVGKVAENKPPVIRSLLVNLVQGSGEMDMEETGEGAETSTQEVDGEGNSER